MCEDVHIEEEGAGNGSVPDGDEGRGDEGVYVEGAERVDGRINTEEEEKRGTRLFMLRMTDRDRQRKGTGREHACIR